MAWHTPVIPTLWKQRQRGHGGGREKRDMREGGRENLSSRNVKNTKFRI